MQQGKLRRTVIGWAHYCPGCDELHVIPDRWTFDGNTTSPTFMPSVLTSGVRHQHGTLEAVLVNGKPIPYRCHYHLTAGRLQFLSDCTHALRSTTVALPALPNWAQDDPLFK